jgi:hypothetical protein
MALAQRVGAQLLAQAEGAATRGIIEQIIDALRREFGDEVWALYHRHADDVLLTRRVVFLTVTLRVKHARRLFELIAGPEPTA